MRTKMMIMRTMRMIILIMMIIKIKTKNGGDQGATVEVDHILIMMTIMRRMKIMRRRRRMITFVHPI